MVEPRYLLDTNVLSEPLRPRPNAALVSHLGLHRAACATAAVVWCELLYGLARLPSSRQRAALQAYLEEAVRGALDILPYDAAAAGWHAAERARLSRLGRPPSFVDGQIAAIARVNGLVLVTRNVSDYKDFEGVDIENWFS